MDIDYGSWQANPSLSKQMLQENAWRIISYQQYHTNEYTWQQASVLVGRQQLLLSTSSVTSHNSSAMSADMIQC